MDVPRLHPHSKTGMMSLLSFIRVNHMSTYSPPFAVIDKSAACLSYPAFASPTSRCHLERPFTVILAGGATGIHEFLDEVYDAVQDISSICKRESDPVPVEEEGSTVE